MDINNIKLVLTYGKVIVNCRLEVLHHLVRDIRRLTLYVEDAEE